MDDIKEEEEKGKENRNKEEEEKEKVIKLKEEIDNYEKSIKKITLKIEQKNKEIDGLFFYSKKIIYHCW